MFGSRRPKSQYVICHDVLKKESSSYKEIQYNSSPKCQDGAIKIKKKTQVAAHPFQFLLSEQFFFLLCLSSPARRNNPLLLSPLGVYGSYFFEFWKNRRKIRPLLLNHLQLLVHLSVPLLSISPFLQDSLFFKTAPLLACPSPLLFFALFLFTLNKCKRKQRKKSLNYIIIII